MSGKSVLGCSRVRFDSNENLDVLSPNAFAQIINAHEMGKKATGFKNMPANIKPPIHSDQCPLITDGVPVVNRWLEMRDPAISAYPRTKARRLAFLHHRHSEDMRTPGLECPSNLGKNLRRMKNVLKHILGDVQINAFIGKGKCFKVFRAKPADNPARFLVGEKLRGDVLRTLSGKTLTGTAITGGGFMDGQAAPVWKVRFNGQHEGSFPGDAAAI